MKILHTSDWHIGKKLKGITRIQEFTEVLQEIVRIAVTENVDCIIVAGDIFDTYTPSADAVELFNKTIIQIRKSDIELVLIAGNHDSPKMLQANSPILKELGVHIIANINAFEELDDNIIRINKNNEKLHIAAIPWVNESTITRVSANRMNQTEQQAGGLYSELLSGIYHDLTDALDDDAIKILSSHVLVNEAKIREANKQEDISERRISLDKVAYGIQSSQLPKQLNYIALGHIHQPQEIIHDCPVHYAGSILQLSFAEAEQEKYVNIIDCSPTTLAKIKKIPLKSGKRLKEIKGQYNEVIEIAEQHIDKFIKITITDEQPPKDYRTIIEKKLPNVIDIRVENTKIKEIKSRNKISKQLSDTQLYEEYLNERTQSTNKKKKEKIELFRQLLAEAIQDEAN
jgi:exonuclease SbcD